MRALWLFAAVAAALVLAGWSLPLIRVGSPRAAADGWVSPPRDVVLAEHASPDSFVVLVGGLALLGAAAFALARGPRRVLVVVALAGALLASVQGERAWANLAGGTDPGYPYCGDQYASSWDRCGDSLIHLGLTKPSPVPNDVLYWSAPRPGLWLLLAGGIPAALVFGWRSLRLAVRRRWLAALLLALACIIALLAVVAHLVSHLGYD